MSSYGYFHIPDSLKVNKSNSNFSEFEWSPFERGFGHTIGNSIRRVLLSSIASPAIVSIRLSPFIHEFMSADGIFEDMTNIAMNFKNVLIKLNKENEESSEVEFGKIYEIEGAIDLYDSDIEEAGGSVEITAGDMIVHELIEVINPDEVLFTCTSRQRIEFKVKFMLGRGYLPVDKSPLKGQEEDSEILIDGLFSPVKLVTCKVENSRVGSSTDYDKIVMSVKTDGRISPIEALSHSLQVSEHFFSKVKTLSESKINILDVEESSLQGNVVEEDKKILDILSSKIQEMDFTVRASNCLKESGVIYFGELVLKDESEMLEIKNLGKKSLDELRTKIQDQVKENGVYMHFGMDLSKYGITKENAREFFDKHSVAEK